MKTGIVSYGAYIPRNRISTEEIASVWGKNSREIEKSLGISQKSVASMDEDTVTLAYESASMAFKQGKIVPTDIESCFVGSESHPYAVNPTATTVAEFLGIGHHYLAADLEFACKAATTGIIVTLGLVASQKIKLGLVVGADTAQARPHDILEYTAAAASAAYIIGSDKDQLIAWVIDTTSFSSDTPDFWRRDGVRFPSHGGRFSGEPAYFTHVESAAQILLQKNKMQPADFNYCIFHMPNGKFPRQAATRLGFTQAQLSPSLIVDKIGNPYSASSLLGLASILDIAKPDQYIFLVSYGSGAGSDAFILKTTKHLPQKRKSGIRVDSYFSNTVNLSYTQYLRTSGKI